MPPPDDSKDFLLQDDVVQDLLRSAGKVQWQPLFLSIGEDTYHLTVFCALLNDEASAGTLDSPLWDLLIGNGRPGFCQSHAAGQAHPTTSYLRFGSSTGVRPLVLSREFHGAYPDYLELDEEFRLYHNLAHDPSRGLLLTADRSGREIEVVRITPRSVTASLKYLSQFLAGTRLHLAVFIDSRRFSRVPIDDFSDAEQSRAERSDRSVWDLTVAKCSWDDKFKTFSRLVGKVIVDPPAMDRAGIWPFESQAPDPTVEFIIGVDGHGNEVLFSCEHERLNNYFGANPGAPHYLTPVYFRREVLAAYYAEPHRYSIADGRLACLSLWSCQIDNDHDDYVVVFLGDLGRDLPYEERLHWRKFNIAPGAGISKTNYQRSFLAQFADASAADLTFRREYSMTKTVWLETQGWPIFLEPSEADAHLLGTLRIPLSQSQPEFDEQVGILAKLMVDSLNEAELKARCGELPADAKGIAKLAAFLQAVRGQDDLGVCGMLRGLQNLRSKGSAHRKGTDYESALRGFGADPGDKVKLFREILRRASESLAALRGFCGAGRLANKPQQPPSAPSGARG